MRSFLRILIVIVFAELSLSAKHFKKSFFKHLNTDFTSNVICFDNTLNTKGCLDSMSSAED
jgi:hypothetical protein